MSFSSYGGYKKIRTPKRTLILTRRLQKELKHPLGTLIKGTRKGTMKELEETIRREKPECIISVGDVVSQSMLKQSIQPHVIIVDNRVMRENTEPIETTINKKINVKNPAGTLTPEAWVVMGWALKQKQPSQVLVEGEEDLLTLVAVLKAPENSLVVYGQPGEGVVAVKVDKTTKAKVHQIIIAMEPLPKS